MGLVRNTFSDWGDLIAARFGGRWTYSDNGTKHRIIPKEEAIYFTTEFHDLWDDMLKLAGDKNTCPWWELGDGTFFGFGEPCDKPKYPVITEKASITFSRMGFATILALPGVDHGVGDSVYAILGEDASVEWFGKMQEMVAYLTEMESWIGDLPTSMVVRLNEIVDSVGSVSKNLVETSGDIASGVVGLMLPLLVPVGLVVGGLVLGVVVLQKTGALGTIGEAVGGFKP